MRSSIHRSLAHAAPIAAVAIGLLTSCSADSGRMQALGTLERDRLELIAESNERIVELAVHEGDHVDVGTLLLRQEAGTMEPRLAQARASVAEARAPARRARERSARARDRRGNARRSRARRATCERRRRNTTASRALVERHLLSASELDRARATRDQARASRDEASASLRLLREGTRSEQLDQARAAVERERAALAELEVSAARYIVRAPRGGSIEALPFKLGERPPVGRAGRRHARRRRAVRTRATCRSRCARRTRRHEASTSRSTASRGELQGTVRYVSARGHVHAVLRADAEGSHAPELPRARSTLDELEAHALPAGVPVEVTLRGLAAQTETTA